MCEIVFYLVLELKELGIQVDVVNVYCIEELQWENYDCVVIGVFICYGYYYLVFQEFVKKYVMWLNLMLSVFYFVNLVVCKLEKCILQINSYVCKFLMNL